MIYQRFDRFALGELIAAVIASLSLACSSEADRSTSVVTIGQASASSSTG